MRPYVIYRDHLGAGFWSNFGCVLEGVAFADRHQLAPVVDMERYPSHYTETDEAAVTQLGTRNGWEYFFDQPAGLSLAEALARDPLDNQGSTEMELIDYGDPRGARILARQMVTKYIRIKPAILAKVESVLPLENNPGVLGVHVRGTDQRAAIYASHPIAQPTLYYLEVARQMVEEWGYERVFLACDELDTLAMFQDAFGSRLLSIPAHRTAAAQETATDYGWLFSHPRPLHRYLLGLEALMDALLLARCEHMVCGSSNLSRCAGYFAADSQTSDLLPPLWATPKRSEPSRGQARLRASGPFPYPPSPAAVAAQLSELRRLLALTENNFAAALQDAEQQRLGLEAGLLHQQTLIDTLATSKAHLKEELAESHKVIQRLRRRVLKLVNAWTWLGWRLFPWTRPSWRNEPLRDCEVSSSSSIKER